MPNFNIPFNIQEYILNRVKALAQRPCNQIQKMFPLTVQEIQDMVLDPDTCGELQNLMNRGIQTISKHSTLRLAFLRERIPELKRSAVILVNAPNDKRSPWFVKYSTQFSISGEVKYDANSTSQYIVADLGLLSAERREKLITWLDRAIRQERIREVALKISREIVKNHAKTTTHLQVLFPALTKVFESNKDSYLQNWAEKFRNPARSLYRYTPEAWVELTFKPLFPVVEAAINAGNLIGKDIDEDAKKLRVKVEHWERLENDVKFPLKRVMPASQHIIIADRSE